MAANGNDNVKTQVQVYEKRYFKKFENAAKSVRDALENKLKEIPIRFSASFRAKKSDSLEKKVRELIKKGLLDCSIESWLPTNGRSRDKDDSPELPKLIKDLAGVRISLYFPSDWPFVEDIILDLFMNVRAKVHPEKPNTRSERQQFEGYVARHYYVDTECGYRVEIQVASAMMHAWIEAEHDTIYKEEEDIEPHELATIDGLNGLALAGDTILNGLKLQLLNRDIIKYKENHERLSFQKSALEQSKKEFTLIGQNLYRTMVGEDDTQKGQAEKFKNQLIECLKNQGSLHVYIIVADPKNDQQMKRFGYGFSEFNRHLCESLTALKKLQELANENRLCDRLHVGTHEKISLDSLTLSDPKAENGVAYLTYTSLGSDPEHRAIRKIEKRKHEDHFKEIVEDHYGWRLDLKPFMGLKVAT